MSFVNQISDSDVYIRPHSGIILPQYEVHVNTELLKKLRENFLASAVYEPKELEVYSMVTKLVKADDKRQIHIIDKSTKVIEKTFHSGHTKSIKRLDIWEGKGSMIILSCSSDSNVRTFDFESAKFLKELSGHRGRVNCIGISHDLDIKSAMVVSGGEDATVRVFYLGSGRQRLCLIGHEHPIMGVSFTDPKHSVGGHELIASIDQTGEIGLGVKQSGVCKRILS